MAGFCSVDHKCLMVSYHHVFSINFIKWEGIMFTGFSQTCEGCQTAHVYSLRNFKSPNWMKNSLLQKKSTV